MSSILQELIDDGILCEDAKDVQTIAVCLSSLDASAKLSLMVSALLKISCLSIDDQNLETLRQYADSLNEGDKNSYNLAALLLLVCNGIGTGGGDGGSGTDGEDGWSPILAVVTDDERRVLQVVDWTGGEGTKPTTGLYIGATGLTANIALAVDIRGPQGAQGDAGVDGNDGLGVPAGGATNEALIKSSATDNDTEWSLISNASLGDDIRIRLVTLADGATITPDVSTDGRLWQVTLGGNRTLALPDNLVAGTYVLYVIQDGSGNNTLAYAAGYRFPGGTAPTLSTGANAVDILTFVSNGTNMDCVETLDFQAP